MTKFISILLISVSLSPWVASAGSHSNSGSAELVFICHKGLHYNHILVVKSYSGWLDEPRLVDNKPLKPKLLALLGVTEDRYKRSWDKMFFRRALIPPILKENDQQVIEYVASHTEGLGYVSSNPNHPDIEVCGVD